MSEALMTLLDGATVAAAKTSIGLLDNLKRSCLYWLINVIY